MAVFVSPSELYGTQQKNASFFGIPDQSSGNRLHEFSRLNIKFLSDIFPRICFCLS